MKYIITDTSIIRINETFGTIQNRCNSKIELSDNDDFDEVYLLQPMNTVSFKGNLYARAHVKKGINIKFYVVPFISEGTASSTPASGGNTDTEHTAAETDDYLNNLLNGGDDGYNNDDVDNYLNNLINGGNDGYNNDDVDNYFSGLMTG